MIGTQSEVVQTQVCLYEEEVLSKGKGVEGGDDREGVGVTETHRQVLCVDRRSGYPAAFPESQPADL